MKVMSNRIKVTMSILMVILGSAFASVLLIEDIMIWIIVVTILGSVTYSLFNEIRLRYLESNKYEKVFRWIFMGIFFLVSICIQVLT